MEGNFSFKELYDVTIKSTYPIEVDGYTFEPGEVIAMFDKIALADFKEDKQFITAHGGYQDAPRVFWETTKDVRVSFSQGVFSKTQYALLNNARLLRKDNTDGITVSRRDRLETDENGAVELTEMPNDWNKVFVRCATDGVKMKWENDNGKSLIIYDYSDEDKPIPYLDVIIDYTYNYESDSISVMQIGKALTNGFLQFEGKTRVKDDVTGHNVTALIRIPKLKLTSQLSLRLGQGANPVVGYFNGLIVPTGSKGEATLEIIYLDDDIDADIM